MAVCFHLWGRHFNLSEMLVISIVYLHLLDFSVVHSGALWHIFTGETAEQDSPHSAGTRAVVTSGGCVSLLLNSV
jgi:hypothetical protein